MKLAVIIPSKNSHTELLSNLKKNELINVFNQVDYFILVDTVEEKNIYENTLKNIENLVVTAMKTKFQSDRYLYFLKNLEYDFYSICSDDVYFTYSNDQIDEYYKYSLLNSINENKSIINHPFIPNSSKKIVIDLFEKFQFNIICIDTLISYCFPYYKRSYLPIICHHLNKKKIIQIKKSTYLLYIKDLLTFYKFIIFKINFFRVNKDNIKIIYRSVFDILSAFKNYLKS